MYGLRKCFQLLCTLVVIYPFVFCHQYTTYPTGLGVMKGEIINKGTEKVVQFRKIPYAKSPTGNLRFQKPQEYGPWNGTLDATGYPPSCMQVKNILFIALTNKNVSEDCLFLNIYVPRFVTAYARRSVMIWLHGGSFLSGQASSHDGSDLALKGDVIVVTVNYRLGIFGFASSGDSLLPGNYGLWDQRMAIMWVKNNIAHFGGNTNSITLFGSSAGSWSANIHALNPLNQGLFHRVILQSGTILSSAGLIKSSNLLTVAGLLDCYNKSDTFHGYNHSDIIHCLQQKPAKELLDASTVMTSSSSKQAIFTNVIGAVIDGEILPDHPMKLLQNFTSPSYRFFRSLDIIIGTTNGEGSVLGFNNKFLSSVMDGIPTSIFCGFLCTEITKELYNNVSIVSEAVCKMYKVKNGETAEKAEQGRQTANMIGDVFFIKPAIELLDIHSRNNLHSKSYQYSFENELVTVTPMPSWYRGSNHGAEVVVLFNLELYALFTGTKLSKKDKQLKDDLLIYWTNFANTGDPNSYDNDTALPLWLQYGYNDSRNYVQLNHNIVQSSRLFEDRVAFWLETIPALVNPVIKTTSGQVRGETVQYPMGTVVHFRGIPYAKPPVNNLRFQKSQLVDKWNDTLDATQYKSACMQRDSEQLNRTTSEDCLFLNIYVPGRPTEFNNKAVMVWIHDNQHFTRGKGDTYDGSLLALKGDVIVVTFNYRLDVFGFLTSNDSNFKGNYGLWDQRLALTWVKNNIAHFGGNPSAITIFGDGASVTLQTITPLNKGLFQRAIAQGGNALSPFAFSKNPKDIAYFYADSFKCKTDTSEALSKCLRNHSAKDLLELNFKMKEHSAFDMPFKPTVDGELFPTEPIKLISDISNENLKTTDLIVGLNSGEGSNILNFLKSMYNSSIVDGVSQAFVCGVWSLAILSSLGIDDKTVQSRICETYKLSRHDNATMEQYGQQALSMLIDAFLLSTTIQFLKLHSKQNSKSYQYLFSRENSSFLKSFEIPAWFDGAGHGTEIGYVFQAANFPPGSADLKLSDTIMTYWSNFAKTGDPNSKGLPKWTNVGYSHRKHYIEFGNDTVIRQKQMLHGKKMKFWFNVKGLKYTDEESRPISSTINIQPSLTLTFVTLFYFI